MTQVRMCTHRSPRSQAQSLDKGDLPLLVEVDNYAQDPPEFVEPVWIEYSVGACVLCCVSVIV